MSLRFPENHYFLRACSRHSEDMITLLGKRPFSTQDDMDKWLDENHKQERSAPPPFESAPEPAVAPAASKLRDTHL